MEQGIKLSTPVSKVVPRDQRPAVEHVKLTYTEDVEKYRSKFLKRNDAEEKNDELTDFHRRMARADLSEAERIVLKARFVDNLTFRTIAEANGMSLAQVYGVYKAGLAGIKRRGIA
jgi:DNA-directed RNA polymerase specialized sigma subunit